MAYSTEVVRSESAGRWRAGLRDPARQRLAVWAALALALVFSVFTTVLTLRGVEYGFDFRGIWHAAARLIQGRPVYTATSASALQSQGNALIAPPFIALLAAPLAHLPFTAATLVWNAGCMGALVAGLRVLGVRDGRVLVLASASFPAISALMLGQPDGLFVLAGAVAWRHRGTSTGAVAVGVLIAAKLLAWPLIVWLIVTRRWRCAAVAASSAALLLIGSWSLIDFRGLSGYLHLLGADASAYGSRSYSVAGLAMRLGASAHLAEVLGVAAAAAASAVVLSRGRRTDRAWFATALLFGLLSSPILWSHYLLVLTVVLAIAYPRMHPVWLAFGTLFWISPIETASSGQVAAVLVLAVSLVAIAAGRSADRRAAQAAAATARSSARALPMI